MSPINTNEANQKNLNKSDKVLMAAAVSQRAAQRATQQARVGGEKGEFSNDSLKGINRGYPPIHSQAQIPGGDNKRIGGLSPYLDINGQEEQFGQSAKPG